MTELPISRNPVEELAEEFLARYRRGERPPITEYTQKHPELAEEIREFFPALVLIEEAGPREVDRPFRGKITADGQAPSRLGDYRILREIGRGGMGVVYEAIQESLGRHVALKVLPFDAAADPTCLKRFSREAHSAARLHHSNIVPVYDVGEHQGVPYYAMQLIQGQGLDQVLLELRRLRLGKDLPASHSDLSRRVAEGVLSGLFVLSEPGAEIYQPASDISPPRTTPSARPKETPAALPPLTDLVASTARPDCGYYRSVARLGLQAAEALAYAHGQKVLHRDVKPSNLLLDLFGRLWITDFGLAKEGSEDLTRAGDIVGTVRYLAPERFSGHSDARGDIYSLGLTLYELLTLRAAFEDSDRGRLIHRITHADPAPPRSHDRHLPCDLEIIVQMAIAKEPFHRYQTAEALAEDLRRFLADRPILARRTSWASHAWRWVRRNPGWAATLGAALGFLLLIAVGGVIFSVHLQGALASSREAELEKVDKLWLSLLQRASAKRTSGRVGQRFESLQAIREAAQIRVTPQLRDEAAAALILPDMELAREWEGCDPDTIDVAFDSSFGHYVTLDRNGSLAVWRLTTGGREEVTRLPPHGRTPFGSLLMSPDGRFVAYGHSYARVGTSGGLRVWRLDPTTPAVVIDEQVGVHETALAFHSQSRYLAVGDRQGTVSIYDPETGRRLRRLDVAIAPHTLAFHPHDGRLAVACGNAVRLFEVASGRELTALRHASEATWTTGLAWHPDGRRLATAGNDCKIHIWDAETGVEVMTPWDGQNELGMRIAFNHAGDRLVSGGWSGQGRFWDAATGRLLLTIPISVGLQFSLDNGLLGCRRTGNTLRLWRLAGGGEMRLLRRRFAESAEETYAAAVHSNGRLLATSSQIDHLSPDTYQSWLGFFDIAAGEEVASVRLSTGMETQVHTFQMAGELLTGGTAGVLIWPSKFGGSKAGAIRIGPPQRLTAPLVFRAVGASNDGRVLALPEGEGAVVLNRNRPGRRVRLGPQQDVRSCAVSPDGRWVLTCSHWGDTSTARVWDAETGKELCDLGLEGTTKGGFSPDGRWLAASWFGGWRLWEVGNWHARLHFPNASTFAFSWDGRMVALSDTAGIIRLVELESGREVAQLTGPEALGYQPVCFSPDATRLVAICPGGKGVCVWDLRLLRSELKEMGLDWDWPEFPTSQESSADGREPSHTALRATIDAGFLTQPVIANDRQAIAAYSVSLALCPLNREAYLMRAQAHSRLGNSPAAIADYSCFLALAGPNDERRAEALIGRALNHEQLQRYDGALDELEQLFTRHPDCGRWDYRVAAHCNVVAWHYAKSANGDLQTPGSSLASRVLELARKAVRIEPFNLDYQNTLGVVLYRLGHYQEAVDCLEHNLAAQPDNAAHDLYFLAMSYERLSRSEKARDCFNRANSWWQARPNLSSEHAAELAAFRAEAAALLGLPISIESR